MAKVIVVDEQRCMGCKQCMTECAMAHTQAATLIEALRGGEQPQPRVHVEPIGTFGMPMQCRHCEDAPCVAVCPTGAVYRHSPGAPVLLDVDKCIGCKACVLACPFGVMEMSRSGKAVAKCDLCIHRTAKGQEPACVAGCPTGALEFANMEQWLRERRRQAAQQAATASAAAKNQEAK